MLLAAGRAFDRTEVAAQLLGALAHEIEQWTADPTPTFDRWRDSLATLGRDVTILAGDATLRGRARDVEPDGTLLLELPGGRLERLVSGEVSVRD
jgi:BirA family biotin operon repressor/biotin-[acetyl-CoA-carboxylase] ligase